MELSEQSRKKALEAFKCDFKADMQYIRDSMSVESVWDAVVIKAKLHRLKGGASFLGLTEIQKVIVELESKAMIKPIVFNNWIEQLDLLEQLVQASS